MSLLEQTATPSDAGALAEAIEAFVVEHGLLERSDDDLIRLPMLMRGELVVPPVVSRADADAALGDRDQAELGEALLVREEILEPGTLRGSGAHVVHVLPRVPHAHALLIHDPTELAEGLYAAPLDSVLDVVSRLGEAFGGGTPLLDRVGALTRLTSDTPPAFLDVALANMGEALDGERMLAQVDRELAHGDVRGHDLLEGWVDVGTPYRPGLSAALAGAVDGAVPAPRARALRALPTRQLHITAGNSPMIPLMSTVRALALKSAPIVKVPSGALVAGGAMALALHFAAGEHPVRRATSIVYWRGGDERIEGPLFSSPAIDRIVVWGSPGSVESVVTRAPMTKTVTFNPRYAISIVGREALAADRDEAVRRVATDALVWNQKACIATLVTYVEGSDEDARAFAVALGEQLGRWDAAYPNPLPPDAHARVRRARRGGMAGGEWNANGAPTAPSSAAVFMPGPFELMAHPMTRVVAVRAVDRAEDVVATLHHAVSQVGIVPEDRRLELRDAICARGVSCCLPLGEADAFFDGMPHDGMRPMSELVNWVVG